MTSNTYQIKMNLPKLEFWKNKTVLVTGHTGFKGSWLVLWLQSLGANVVGYALEPNIFPNMFQACTIKETMASIIADIRDIETLRKTFKKYSPDIVFHLAAQPLVLASYDDPVDTYSTNVMGTLNIFEAARECDKTQVIVNITSD